MVHSSDADFPTTQWSRVLAAGHADVQVARQAVGDLCRDYWYPLYAFVRYKGYGPEDAMDLVQGLFARLLERDDLRGLDPSKGRLRSYLMACCQHHLADVHDHDRAVKRGGGRDQPELASAREPSHDLTAERLFDQRWAQTLLGHVLGAIEAEMRKADHHRIFEWLKPSLVGEPDAPSYRQIAAETGLSIPAVKMIALRIRGRYRVLVREEIARTVADPAEIDDEIRALIGALGR